MSVARKLNTEPALQIFHATMLVTRAEEWWVQAESLEEAEALLAAGKAIGILSVSWSTSSSTLSSLTRMPDGLQGTATTPRATLSVAAGPKVQQLGAWLP